MRIKVGTKLIACNDLFIDDALCLAKGNVYTVQTSDKENYVFSIIDEEGDIHCFDFSDVPDVWFNFYKTKKDKIVKQVTDKFKERSKVGIEKYGTTLEENNTDDFYRHLQEELMDATLYIEKLKSQSETLLQAKHNELIQQFEKLKKEQLEYFSEVELINHLGKKGYSITIKREL